MEKQLIFSRKYLYLIVGMLVLLGLYLSSLYNYLLFHTFAEIFSVVIALAIFVLAWNSRQFLNNHYFIFIGIAFLFAGVLDLLHTLAYKGMGVFQGYDANLPTQLWIAFRYFQSLSFLIAPFFITRKIRPYLLFVICAVSVTLLLLSVFYWEIFPACFIEGIGLTPFKKISEYIISLIFLASIAFLLKKQNHFDRNVLQWLVWSIVFAIACEFAFTFYISVYGLSNLIGHYFEILSFYLIYKAIIETGLSKPYHLLFRDLKQSEEALQHALQESKQRETEIAALLEGSQGVLNYRDFKGSAQSIFNSCKNLIGASAGYISLLSKDGKENEVAFLESGGLPCTADPNLPMPIRGLREVAYRTGKTIFHNNFCKSEYMEFMPEGHASLDNVLFAPLTISGKVIGLLGIANKPGGFNENDVRMASAFGELAAIALYNSRTLESLETNEERFRSVVQTANDAIVSVDSHGNIIFWNKSAESIFGYSFDEVIGKPLTFIIPERFREAHQKAMDRVVSTGKSNIIGKTVEMAGLRRDGSEFPVEISLASSQTREGTFFTGIIRDVTERKKAEEALRRSRDELEIRVRERTAELAKSNQALQFEIEEHKQAGEALRQSEMKYRIVADNTYDWEWWRDPKENFVYVSPSCTRVTHHEAEEFIKNPDLLLKIIHPDDRSSFIRHQIEVEEKLAWGETEFRILRPDGSFRWLAHACQPVFNEQGRFLGRRGSNRDITERKIAEEALSESEKRLRLLSSELLTVQESERKRIAREIHDGIGQTLAAIKFALESKLGQMGGGAASPEASVENIISLAQNGIEESRRIQMDLRPSILDDLGILATLSWFTREFQKVYSHISIEKEIDLQENEVPDSLKVPLFRVIQEALNNIAKHSKAALVRLSLGKNEDKIELNIEDNGMGFDLENYRKGLGLTSMRERTELLGGSFAIESAPGKGTTIRASWPI